MKQYHLIIFLILLITGCCKDELLFEYSLTNEEKSNIPYTLHQNINFLDEENNLTSGVISAIENKKDTVYLHAEQCDQKEIETLTAILDLPSKDLQIEISLIADRSNKFNINILRGDSLLDCEYSYSYEVQELYEDIIVEGFEYQNVIVFQDCHLDSGVETIIYSTTNGIEFVQFSNQSWLKIRL